jgi:agmatine deiminase
MITNSETNLVYFSSMIETNKHYKAFWNRLEEILNYDKIYFNSIENTKDIWCRDYMPVQISENEFVQFSYFPDYCLHPKYHSLITHPTDYLLNEKFSITNSELIIDGGNIVKSGNAVIMTDKVFTVNRKIYGYSYEKIISKLKSTLKTDNISIIPKLPGDIFGHADGMVRFLNDDILLVADYSDQSYSWQKKMDLALKRTGLKLISFPAFPNNDKNKDHVPSAKGIYINFAQIGNTILFPQFDLPKSDREALLQMIDLYPDCKVIPVNCNEIAIDGGVLNCITWNIKIPDPIKYKIPPYEFPVYDDLEQYIYDRLNLYLSTHDYEFILFCFKAAWDENRGDNLSAGDFQHISYQMNHAIHETNPIPQYFIDYTINLIIDYLESNRFISS